jgi:hypothetical protein
MITAFKTLLQLKTKFYMAEHNELGNWRRNGCRISTKTALSKIWTFKKQKLIFSQKKTHLPLLKSKHSSLNLIASGFVKPKSASV